MLTHIGVWVKTKMNVKYNHIIFKTTTTSLVLKRAKSSSQKEGEQFTTHVALLVFSENEGSWWNTMYTHVALRQTCE